MMSGVNKVIIIGRLGQDPEQKTLGNGNIVTTMSLATSEVWFDKDKKKQEKTEWHRCVAWNKTAELIGQYLKKGQQTYIEGSLQTRTYDDKDGKKCYTTEINVKNVTFLSSGNSQGGQPPGPGEGDAPGNQGGQGSYGDDQAL